MHNTAVHNVRCIQFPQMEKGGNATGIPDASQPHTTGEGIRAAPPATARRTEVV